MSVSVRTGSAADGGSDLTGLAKRLTERDPTIWGPDAEAEAAQRLGWLDLP